MGGGTSGVGSRLEIEVPEPAVRHTVTLAQLQRWANGATKSRAARIRRERMRELRAVNTIQGSPHEPDFSSSTFCLL